MKFTYEQFKGLIKLRQEKSTISDNCVISRSVIGLRCESEVQTFVGFGAGFDGCTSANRSMHELLEHLIFLPCAHTEISMNAIPIYRTGGVGSLSEIQVLEKFYIGKHGPSGAFSANGCAISGEMEGAIYHSKNELFERHLCCEIWYNRTRPLLAVSDFYVPLNNNGVCMNYYTTETNGSGQFGLVSIDCPEGDFFALGSAVRETTEAALMHAASEAIMLFEDAKKSRTVKGNLNASQRGVLSLRDRNLTRQRKEYIDFIVNHPPRKMSNKIFECESICFQPLKEIYAARSYSSFALDPKNFTKDESTPSLPLY